MASIVVDYIGMACTIMAYIALMPIQRSYMCLCTETGLVAAQTRARTHTHLYTHARMHAHAHTQAFM